MPQLFHARYTDEEAEAAALANAAIADAIAKKHDGAAQDAAIALRATIAAVNAADLKRIEGNGARNVLRRIQLRLTPGDTPGTNIDILHRGNADYGFNWPTITDVTNLEAGQTDNELYFAATGTYLRLDIAENIIAVLAYGVAMGKWNSASVTEMYFGFTRVDVARMRFQFYKRGATTPVDIRTILAANDQIEFWIEFMTSS